MRHSLRLKAEHVVRPGGLVGDPPVFGPLFAELQQPCPGLFGVALLTQLYGFGQQAVPLGMHACPHPRRYVRRRGRGMAVEASAQRVHPAVVSSARPVWMSSSALRSSHGDLARLPVATLPVAARGLRPRRPG